MPQDRNPNQMPPLPAGETREEFQQRQAYFVALNDRALSNHISFDDFTPGAVVAALWNNATPEPGGRTDEMTAEEGQRHLDAALVIPKEGSFSTIQAHLSTLEGREIRFDYWDTSFTAKTYDRHNGEGLLARVLDHLRATGSVGRLPR